MSAGDAAGGAPDASASSGGAPREAGASDSDAEGGTLGSDGSPPGLTLVAPVRRGNLDVLEFGNTTFTVDGTHGARITGFTLDGKNVLTAATAAWPEFWGSTFWTAPQTAWWPSGAFPPDYAPIDNGPYVTTVGADSSISAQGGTATFAGEQLAVSKVFTADLQTGSIVIQYTIANKGTAPVVVGHWEVTRVFPGGLTFYPAAAADPSSYGSIVVQRIGAYEWFDEARFNSAQGAKSWGDAAAGGGWVAHVTPDPAGDIVLVKTFADVPPGAAGTGDGAVEIYVQAGGTYEEVETHNQLVTIMPGQAVPWTVHWYLRRLPQGAMRAAGNQALVDFVKAQIR
jgi:hypothetical protein